MSSRKNARKHRKERSAYRRSQRGENKFTKREGVRLVPGGLEGWHANESAAQRHSAIKKAIRRNGYATTIRRLTVIGNLDENSSPETTRKVREDVHWAQQNFGERDY
jgi:Family of unknown function (DUF5771)